MRAAPVDDAWRSENARQREGAFGESVGIGCGHTLNADRIVFGS